FLGPVVFSPGFVLPSIPDFIPLPNAINLSAPTPPDFRATMAGSWIRPLSFAVRSSARLARLRNSRAKQVSTPPAPYSPCQLPLGVWLVTSSSAPQVYQSFLPMVSSP